MKHTIEYHKGEALNQLDVMGEDSLFGRVVFKANKLGEQGEKLQKVEYSFNYESGYWEVILFTDKAKEMSNATNN